MADVKRFVIIDENGQIVEQTNNMTIEVDAGVTERSVVNKGQLDQVAADAAAAVASEQTRATTAETALGDSISTLQGLLADLSSSTSGDLTLINNRITQEIADRIADVDAEEARALAAEAALQTAINTEVTDRQAAVTAEAAARDAADVALGLRIDAEEAARSTLDTTLRGLITDEATTRAAADTTLQNNIDAEATARAAADATLQSNIDAEAAARSTADAALGVRIDTEEAARIAGDAALTAALNAETASRQADDIALQAAIDAEDALRAAEIIRVEGLITAEATARAAADTAEATARADADATLTTNLAAEVTRATGEEARIEAKYDAGIAAEIAARIAGDAANAAAISAETTRASAAEATLTGNLAAEVSRATAREDEIETALDAEVARATAEEIAVENRAKAYADARVQGLKPKDSVDFTMTVFMPRFNPNPDTWYGNPVFRLLNSMNYGDADGNTVSVAGGQPLPADKNGLFPEPEFVGNEWDSKWVVFVKYDGTPGNSPFSYVYSGTVLDGQTLTLTQALNKSNWGPGGAEMGAYYDAGYSFFVVIPEVVDATDPVNAEAIYQKFAEGKGVLPAVCRVAVVQNDIGTSTAAAWYRREFRETVGVSADAARVYLNDPEVNASENWYETASSKFSVDVAGMKVGIYERRMVDGAPVWSRAADFATGMEVSGAYVLSEHGLLGFGHSVVGEPSKENNWWADFYFAFGLTKIAPANVGLFFGSADVDAVNAIVGTHPLRAGLFNRVGSYQFAEGLWTPDPSQPTVYQVRPNKRQAIRVNPEGVGLELGSLADYGLYGGIQTTHLAFVNDDPTNTDYSASRHLALNSPLIEGPQAKADMLHSHECVTVSLGVVPFSDTFPDVASANAYIDSLGRGQPVRINATTGRLEACTWNSPDFIGCVAQTFPAHDASDVYCPTSLEGLKLTTGYVHVAVNGKLEMGYGLGLHRHGVDIEANPELDFAVNEIAYIGGAPFQYVKFSDIPSGAWAIPFAKKISDYHFVILDRPAFLKA